MLRKLIAVAVLLGIVLLIAGAVLWMQSLVPERHRFALSNGSVVTFNQATFGTNHPIAAGGRWSRLLPKFLARQFQPRTGGSSSTTASPAVMLWFEHRKMPNATGYDYVCSLVHPDGTETSFGHGRSYATPWTATNTLEGRSSPYPQREKLLRVRFYEQKNYDDVELLGEFTVRNPSVSRAPVRTAPPLPQHTNDGDLEITLASLEAPAWRDQWGKTNLLGQWTKARFLVTESGRPSTNWGVQGMTATDSTGNKFSSQSWSGGTRKQFEFFECQPVLWQSETYRLRFEFSRKVEARFETNEVWTIHGVSMPTNGGFTLVNTQWNSGAFRVHFHGFNSQNGRPPWSESHRGEPSLGFSVAPAPVGYRFSLVGVRDEQGRQVETGGSSFSSTNWGFGLRFKEPPQTLDVTVALHRSRFVEFHAQPAKWAGRY